MKNLDTMLLDVTLFLTSVWKLGLPFGPYKVKTLSIIIASSINKLSVGNPTTFLFLDVLDEIKNIIEEFP